MKTKFGFLLCVLSIYMTAGYANTFTLNSEDFTSEGVMPVMYSCDGTGATPQLSWTDAPANTGAYALTLEDKSEKYYHWIVYNIPKNIRAFSENQKLTKKIGVAKNSSHETNYTPPCPPKGALHYYVFTIYALKRNISVSADSLPEDALQIIKANSLQSATLKVPYPRWE